jgi:DNA-binding transcriptional ArsR family regulator
MAGSKITWDIGTAYDLFVSLDVLHKPAEFDLRGSWAAGVRARLPSAQRQVLEQSLLLIHAPLAWIYTLPEPKDGGAVLWALRQISPERRLATLALEPAWPPEYGAILSEVSARRRWNEEDVEALNAIYRHATDCHEKKPPSRQDLSKILDWWTRAEEFGERYLEALTAYYDAFFGQEERRIRPALQRAISKAQERAQELPLTDLMEELTQGLRFEALSKGEGVVLAPSYWSTPLAYFCKLDSKRTLYLFGARPPEDSLVPGEAVPEAVLRVQQALSDSTRLLILKYLSEQPLTPTQLAQRLRLRVPTVVHHLKVLRLAGLVRLTLVGENATTKHYAARQEAVELAYEMLRNFLGGGETQGSQKKFEILESDEMYESARQNHLSNLEQAPDMGTHETIPWKRDELQER